jgi:hypothetical protein
MNRENLIDRIGVEGLEIANVTNDIWAKATSALYDVDVGIAG